MYMYMCEHIISHILFTYIYTSAPPAYTSYTYIYLYIF